MTAPACAWCGAAVAGRQTRGMHLGCYRKARHCGALERRRPPHKRDPVPDQLDALVDAIVRRKAAT